MQSIFFWKKEKMYIMCQNYFSNFILHNSYFLTCRFVYKIKIEVKWLITTKVISCKIYCWTFFKRLFQWLNSTRIDFMNFLLLSIKYQIEIRLKIGIFWNYHLPHYEEATWYLPHSESKIKLLWCGWCSKYATSSPIKFRTTIIVLKSCINARECSTISWCITAYSAKLLGNISI